MIGHNGGPELDREDTIGGDLLKGVAAIAAFIGEEERPTHYLLEKKRTPAGRLGGHWVASKRKLRAHFDALTSGEAA